MVYTQIHRSQVPDMTCPDLDPQVTHRLKKWQVPVAGTCGVKVQTWICEDLCCKKTWICGSMTHGFSHGFTCADPWVTCTCA